MKLTSLWARAGVILTLAFGVAQVAIAPAHALSVGQKAPAFTLMSLKGRPLTVDPKIDKRSKLLIFWASW